MAKHTEHFIKSVIEDRNNFPDLSDDEYCKMKNISKSSYSIWKYRLDKPKKLTESPSGKKEAIINLLQKAEEFQGSYVDFCKLYNIKYSNFQFWRSQYKQLINEKSTKPETKSTKSEAESTKPETKSTKPETKGKIIIQYDNRLENLKKENEILVSKLDIFNTEYQVLVEKLKIIENENNLLTTKNEINLETIENLESELKCSQTKLNNVIDSINKFKTDILLVIDNALSVEPKKKK